MPDPDPSPGVAVADVDPPLFRELLGRFATGVTVVTLLDGQGRPAGMTISSFASVSLEPPLVLVCVDHAADLHAELAEAERWTVNVLGEEQEELSRRFAAGEGDRFAGVGYQVVDQRVLLDGAIAHIECEAEARHPGGDHTIFIGRVTGGAARAGRPLLYYRGGYGAPA